MSDLTPIEVHPDARAVALRAADVIAAHAGAAIDVRGDFSLAVSGGRTPWSMLAALADLEIDWSRVSIFQVDERVAPQGDDSRNLVHLLASLSEPARARVRAMDVASSDLDAAARSYEAQLPEQLDLVHLGLGADGHTASLVPGDPVLEVDDRDVALSGPYQDQLRMTLTYRVLDRARMRLWVVTGPDKRNALPRLREHDRSIPAGRVTAESSLIIADVAAAGA